MMEGVGGPGRTPLGRIFGTRGMLAVALVFALAVTAPAIAAKAPYKLGRYSGKIAVDPASGSPGTLAFTVANGAIRKLTAHEKDLSCYEPSVDVGVESTVNYTLNVPRSWKVKIGRSGKFSFKGALPGQDKRQLRFFGKVSGSKASGKIQFSFERRPGVTCTLSGDTQFTAKP
jgi:hypothetical protein